MDRPGSPTAPELPPLPTAEEPHPRGELVERFRRELVRAGGRFEQAADRAGAQAILDDLAGGRRVVSPEDLPAAIPPDAVGIDRADLLIAETGTVVKTYPDRESSRVSLHPSSSVFLATPDAIVPDLASALLRLAPMHREGPAYTVLITGPSRTADIEKVSVTPAHGPRELVVVLIP